MTKPLGPQSLIIDDEAIRAARGPDYLAGFEAGAWLATAGSWAREIFENTGMRVNLVYPETGEQFMTRWDRQQAALAS